LAQHKRDTRQPDRLVHTFEIQVNTQMADREGQLYLASVADEAECYQVAVDALKVIVKQNVELSIKERDLLSAAYKNLIGPKRSAWRVVSAAAEKEGSSEKFSNLVKEFKTKIEGEIFALADEVVGLLKNSVLPHATENESKVFWHKMEGDYHRYSAEIAQGDKRKQVAEKAESAYKSASELAIAHLDASHPIRLGLALNYSVFQYEILENKELACNLAKEAFEKGAANEASEFYNDSAPILQLLRDNLLLWSAGEADKDDDDDDD